MKVCIIGDGLVSLALANVLIQKDLFVDIFSVKKIKKQRSKNTIKNRKENIFYYQK